MPTAEFFEEYPLYKKLVLEERPFKEPSIHAYCKECKSSQTFTIEEDEEYPWTAIARSGGF